MKVYTHIFLFTFIYFFLISTLNADETQSNNFSSSLENWSGTGVSRVSKSSSYRMRISQDKTATKNFNFGSSYANSSVSIEFDFLLDGGWESSGGSKDYFYIISNNSTIDTYSNNDGSYSVNLTTTADSDGKVLLKLRTNTSASGEYAYIDNIEITAFSSNSISICPGEFISELNTTSISASKSYNNVGISSNSTHYYNFTPSVDGTLRVNLLTDKSYNSLYIKNTCSTTLYNDTSDSTSKSSTNINVSENEQIVIAVERRYSTTMQYDLDIDFTAATINVGCDDTLDTVANDSAPGVVVSSMHNITTDTSSCISGTSTAGNDYEYYYFTVLTDGTLDITTSSPNSESYHLKIGSSSGGDQHYPDTTTQSHSVNQITLSSGDSVYFYIKESGAEDDQFQINFDFIAIEDENTSLITNGYRNFTLRKSFYTKGNMKTIGNTILVPPTTQDSSICSTYTNGAFTSNATNGNNDYFLCAYRVDLGTSSSTTSALDLPSGAEIQWAGLYWQSVVKYGDYDFSNQMKIQIKKDSDSYENVTSTTLDYYNEGYTTSEGSSTYSYSAFADVTDILSANSWEGGDYTIANIPTYEGKITSLGTYGAWSLVVIYSDIESATEKLRSFSVFDGWKVVKDESGYRDVQIDVAGFYTPDKSDISASLSVFAAEGDKNIPFDKLTTINNNTAATVELLTETDQTFNSSISGGGTRVPQLINNNGIDIQSYDIGSYLAPLQSSMEFHFTSNQDTYWPSVLAFSTEIYDPDFCYDYAYKQNNSYFTEQNDGSYTPKIIGSVIHSSPVEVSLYIRNQEDSDVIARNTTFSIFDINTTQASYASDSVYVTYPGGIQPTHISDGEISNTDEYIQNIPIGSVDGKEYFYVYYNLDINSSFHGSLDMPIIGHYSYDLVLPTPNGTSLTLPYTTILNDSLPICTDTNFKYLPAYKIFNVVQEDLFNSGGFYNIPTQVVQRPGRFDVVSFDIDDIHLESPVSTMVAVELIDAAAFHDTEASCYEPDSAISTRLWVTFENNVSRTDFDQNTITALIDNNLTSDYILNQSNQISQAREFYEQVRQNTAFRVLWNRIGVATELIQTESTASAGIRISNFSTIATTYPTCKQAVIDPDTGILTSTTSDVCTDKGASSTHLDVAACMECILGYNTEVVCSRDNFSIRPESFNVQVYDTNQSDTDQKLHILQNHTGVTTPITTREKLSSGYIYGFDINATNHYSNSATLGYTKPFGSNSEDYLSIIFEPISALTCNDTSSKTISFNIINGAVSTEDSLEQVGDYRLSMIDTSWTKVDHDPEFMTHHVGSYFVGDISAKECLEDSTFVQPASTIVTHNGIDLTNVNACNISSNHINNEANLTYRDYNLTFLPYKLSLTNLTPSYGNSLITTFPTLEPKARTYISSLNNDNNVSFNLLGQIQATSFTGEALSNFTTLCYAKDVNISLDVTLPNDGDENEFGHRIKITNNAGDTIYSTNNSSKSFILDDNNFSLDSNGSLNISAKYSYDRNLSNAMNPKEITLNNLSVKCRNANQCQMNANFLPNYENNDSKIMNYPLIFLYARTHAGRQRYKADTGTANIFYESFCFGNDCNKTLLPNGINSKNSSDTRWFINEGHTSNDGNAGTVFEKNSLGRVSVAGSTSGNHPDNSTLMTYDKTRGYPYKTTMQNNASSWLIYNQYDSNATTNSFSVEFEGDDSYWSGINETESSTKDSTIIKSNRRSMW